MKFYQVVSLMTALVTQVTALLLVYFFDASDYGYYSLMLVVAQMLFIFVGGWNNSLILNFGTKEYTEKGNIQSVFYSRLIMVLSSSIVCLVLYSVFFEYVKDFIKNDNFADLVLIAFLGEMTFNIVSNIFYAKNSNTFQSLLNAIPKVSILIYLVFFFSGINDYVYFNMYINLTFFILGISIFLKGEFKNKLEIKRADFNFYLKFGFFQVFSLSATYIINWGDNFALSYFNVPIGDIGVYNLSYKVFLSFNVFFGLLNILIPKIVYKYKEKGDFHLIEQLLSYRKWFVLVLSIGYAVALLILKFLLTYFNKTEYDESLIYSLLLFPAFIFMLYVDFIVPIIINSRHYKKVQLTVLLQAFVNVILNVIFVYLYGVVGVVIGTTFSYIFKMVILTYVFKFDVFNYLREYEKI